MVNIDNYIEEKECVYKDERYSVRDNGAVLRHSREGKRKRKDDDSWSFGKYNESNGYAYIGTERVHRIVAFAFLGTPPTPQHVVDHIDTNRRNNRPENLRWLTRLENVLKNPITRARIENICGSIEAFLQNPSVLRGHENADPNFSWMRAVSPEEAIISKERLLEWAQNKPKAKGGTIGEWLFTKQQQERDKPKTISNEWPTLEWTSKEGISNGSIGFRHEIIPEHAEMILNETASLTPNAIQVYWRTPSEFPFCPSSPSEKPLKDYCDSLQIGMPFCKNELYVSSVWKFSMADEDTSLIVLTKSEGGIKPWALAKVTYRDGKFIHKSLGSYFSEDGAMKYFTVAKGEEWTGDDSIDDYC